MPRHIAPTLDGKGRRVAIAAAGFTRSLSQAMLEDAVETLIKHGVADQDITTTWVPGSFELPLVAEAFAETGRYDGVICLGVVIRGETSHYDYVCEGASEGILKTSLAHALPVMFGVLTTEDQAQAEARIHGAKGRKGAECATGLLELLSVLDSIAGESEGGG